MIIYKGREFIITLYFSFNFDVIRFLKMANIYRPISGFYTNKSVFITGATGFIGKVLLEKLLYHCTNIDNIYILIREKNGKNAEDRMNNLKNYQIFERINKEAPQLFDKVKPIIGDITKPNLGINNDDLKVIFEKVSVVFHIAATVNFAESLKTAFGINVYSTKELVKLSKNILKLQALVYVSTAYSNINRSVIDEIVYPTSLDIDTVEYFINNDLDIFEKEILGDHPNSYVYTKSLAENIVLKSSDELPVIIVRPSIVGATLYGPTPGWVDNYNASTMLIAGIQMGVARVVLLGANKISDVVPVDLVANSLIVSAARIRRREAKVYNFTSSTTNPMTWKEFTRYTVLGASKYCSKYTFPSALIISNYTLYFLIAFLLQMLPAYLIHWTSVITGRKSRILDVQDKLWKFAEFTFPFTTRQWLWSNKNVRDLIDTLSISDRKQFDMDVKNIDWVSYVSNYSFGVKKYLLKRNKDKN